MIDLIKGLTEIHNHDICLSAFIQGVKEVLGELDQLCFIAQFSYETMLVLKKAVDVYPGVS